MASNALIGPSRLRNPEVAKVRIVLLPCTQSWGPQCNSHLLGKL